MFFEEVYYNEGKLYKQSKEVNEPGSKAHSVTFYEGNSDKVKHYFDFYKRVNHPVNIWPFVSRDQDGVVKVYYIPEEILRACYDNYGKWKEHPNADISHIKLPKEIEIITSIAVNYGSGSIDSKEVFFICDTFSDMKKIADFYKLPTPLSKDNDFDENDWRWKRNSVPKIFNKDFSDYTRRIEYQGIRLASIRFDETGNAKIFKIYKRIYT